jgi:indolepyruvate ferredoxin oxidoreductase
VTGLAQKNGPVTSHVRVADDPAALHATRIAAGGADVVLGCDIVVTAGADALAKMAPGRTQALVDTRVAPTADFASRPDLDLSSRGMEAAIRRAAGDAGAAFVPASELATALLGDALYANPFLLGCALQRGLLPVGLAALRRAIELNGRAVEANQRALDWGRLYALDPAAVEQAARPALRSGASPAQAFDLDAFVARRADDLRAYQNDALARRYRERVAAVAERERSATPGRLDLAEAVARYYFKLLAYKDEYEVARLWSDGAFRRQLEREFEGDYRVQVHLAPQLFNPRDTATGRARKWAVPAPLAFAFFRALAPFKLLRGTPFDPFGRTAHRRLERRLIADYEALLAELCAGLRADNHELAVALASLPEQIRGFDTVKERHLQDAEAKQAELLAAFRLRAPAT